MPPAELPPPAPELERVVWHDCRMIHDSSLISFGELIQKPENAWVLALIEPDPDSGSATIPGASIDGKTGRVAIPEGADTVLQKKGSYERLAAFGADWPAKGNYAWTEPLDKRTRGLEPEDSYSPFAQGGVIYFRPSPGKPGLGLYGQVRLVPSEWSTPFPQAAAYVRTQPEVPGAEMLKRLLTSQNAVLAILAYRELVTEHGLSGPDLLAPVDRAKGATRAILARLVLDHEKPVLADRSSLDSLLDRATQRDALLPLASAAFSAAQFGGGKPEIVARAKAFLARLRQRLDKLPPVAGSSETVALMSRLAGLAG